LGVVGHGVHEAPQLWTLVFDAHVLVPHRCVPALHVKPQLVPSHVAVAFAGGTQAVHEEVPQLAVLELDAHAAPQAWKPVAQVKPQLVPSQVEVELAGGVHGMHAIRPHELTLVLDAQIAPHGWDPVGQSLLHGTLGSMQAPAHRRLLAGQVPPQANPSQVAVPPVGAVHAVQEVPQVATLVFEAQLWPHACIPWLHVKPQTPPLQVAVPPDGAVHGPQRVPHV
jgi:hypothetical protein